jgi:hypothetical protein
MRKRLRKVFGKYRETITNGQQNKLAVRTAVRLIFRILLNLLKKEGESIVLLIERSPSGSDECSLAFDGVP